MIEMTLLDVMGVGLGAASDQCCTRGSEVLWASANHDLALWISISWEKWAESLALSIVTPQP